MATNKNEINIIVNAVTSGFTANMKALNDIIKLSTQSLNDMSKSASTANKAFSDTSNYKKFSDEIRRSKGNVDALKNSLKSSLKLDGIKNAITDLDKFNNSASKTKNSVESVSKGFGGMALALGAVGAAFLAVKGLSDFTKDVVKTRMEYEKMEAALTATVGIENTGRVFKALQQFAKDTPFDLKQTVTAYQRLINLGIAPTMDMMKAFGNIVSTINGKTMNDWAEAVADGMTGEYERLKEFGYKIKAIGKDGKQVASTYQGVTKVVSTSSDAFLAYLTATAKATANGKAMELQAATTAGRMAALGDTFDQLKNNIAKTTGASTVFGSAIEKITNITQNLSDAFESGAVGSYFDAFKASIQPVLEMMDSLKAAFQGTPIGQFFEDGTSRLQNFWDQLSGLYNEFTDFASYINEFAKNGGLREVWDTAVQAITPFWDILKDLGSWIKENFVEFWQESLDNILKIFSLLPDGVKTYLTDVYNNFTSILRSDDGNLNGQKIYDALVFTFSMIPSFIKKVLYDALDYFSYFASVAKAYIQGVAVAIKNMGRSGDAGTEFLNNALDESSRKLSTNLTKNEKSYNDAAVSIIKSQESIRKKSEQATKTAEAETNARRIATVQAQVEAKTKLSILRQTQKEESKKDIIGQVAKDTIAKQKAGKVSDVIPGSSGSKKKSGSGKSSASKENSEYKKVLDGQIKLEEDRFKQGEVSAKEHYDKLLQLKLAQLGKENTATSEAYQKNLDIINSSTSTESQKKKAIEDNTKLQNQMNSTTEQEKNIRQEIANQLRDANSEFIKNINSIQKELNNISLGGSTTDDTMKEFEEKYSALRKRIQAEDKANGTNLLPKLDQLQAVTKAIAQVSDKQRELNVLEAQYEANSAEINYKVAAGEISSVNGKKQQLDLTKQLTAERVKYLENEVAIAEKTSGYNKVDLANLKTKLNEYKKSQVELSDTAKSIADDLESSFNTAFDSILDGTQSFGDTLKSFLSSLAASLVSTLTKGWGESLAGLFTSGTGTSATTGTSSGGIFSSIGSMFGSLFSSISGHAVGGTMKPNSLNWVGENGPELVYNGSKPTGVMTNPNSQKFMSQNASSGTTINMNITTKDANSFRSSEKQMMVKSQQEANRQINRNT